MSRSAFLLAQVLALTAAAAVPTLYGLGLTHNGPAQASLLTADASTGALSIVGFEPNASSAIELAAMGDLCAVDSARQMYYYLGDTERGATLVGLSLTDGSERCRSAVALKEIGYVGIGQSLDYDAEQDTLLLTGLDVPPPGPNATANATHSVFRAALGTAEQPTCGPFTRVGHFGVGSFAPMLHGSTLDAHGQRLFVDLAAEQSTTEIGVVSLSTGALSSLIPEGEPQSLVGLSYHAEGGADGALVGVGSLGAGMDGVALRVYDIEANTWRVATLNETFVAAGGNDGEVSAFDSARGLLHCLLYVAPASNASDPALHLASVDVTAAQVVHHAPLGNVGICHDASDSCLLQLAMAP